MKKKKLQKRKSRSQNKQSKSDNNLKNKLINKDIFGLAIVILLGIIIYSNSFDCSFQYDDFLNFIDNPKIQKFSDLGTIWDFSKTRFMPYLSLAINNEISNFNVWGYHFFNLLVHLVNAVLVWWLTTLIFSSPILKKNDLYKHKKWIAIFTALLFVSHPLATQSVTYIVQRMASMAAMFYFLSLALYLKARLTDKKYTSKNIFYIGAIVSAIFAMLSKQNAFTLPFSILLFELCFFNTRKFSINFKNYKVLLGIFALVTFLIFMLVGFSTKVFNTIPPLIDTDFRTISPINYLFTQFSVIVKYIQLLILPINLNLDYDYPLAKGFFELRTVLSFLFLSFLFISSLFIFKKYRIFSFGILWFFLTLSIESSFIPISDLIFEHRTYLPSFGFFLIVSCGVYTLLWNKYKYVAISGFILIVGLNSYLTYERNKVWKDEITLWNDVISKSPKKARPYFFRGTVLQKNIKHKEAINDYTQAIKLQPGYKEAYLNRSSSYHEENSYIEAINDCNKALEIDPEFSDAFYNRGSSLWKSGRKNEALQDYSKALVVNPDFLEVYLNQGIIYSEEKRFDEALINFNKIIDLNPTFVEAYINRGILYGEVKNYTESLNNFNRAIELDPNNAQVFVNRGLTQFNFGNTERACIDLRSAIELGHQPAVGLHNRFCQ